MCESLLLRMFVAAALVLAIAPANSETITVSSPVPFASNSGVTAEQRTECAFDTRLPKYIEAAAEPGVEIEISTLPLAEVTGKILELEITRLKDSDGRLLYRRPAGVAVHGNLKENGEEVGSFVAYRYSQKIGKFDGFKGTCARLGRGLDALSRDIVIWLRNPTQNARLGDL